jgi:hypothetical protein
LEALERFWHNRLSPVARGSKIIDRREGIRHRALSFATALVHRDVDERDEMMAVRDVFLHEFSLLRNHANQLGMGEEAELRIVIGDVCPLAETLALVRRFFADHPATRLHRHFEAISGP